MRKYLIRYEERYNEGKTIIKEKKIAAESNLRFIERLENDSKFIRIVEIIEGQPPRKMYPNKDDINYVKVIEE